MWYLYQHVSSRGGSRQLPTYWIQRATLHLSHIVTTRRSLHWMQETEYFRSPRLIGMWNVGTRTSSSSGSDSAGRSSSVSSAEREMISVSSSLVSSFPAVSGSLSANSNPFGYFKPGASGWRHWALVCPVPLHFENCLERWVCFVLAISTYFSTLPNGEFLISQKKKPRKF